MSHNNQLPKYVMLSFIIILISLSVLFIWKKNYTIEQYTYPVTKDSIEWKAMNTKSRIDALIIPQKTLNRMSDKALIEAIVEYPLLVDLYLYGTVEDGLKVFLNQCSAYKELISRSTARESFLTDGIYILDQLSENEEENQVAIAALSDIIRTLYKDININELLLK